MVGGQDLAKHPDTLCSLQNLTVRDACPIHYRWIFGKVPNGLWPPPSPPFLGKMLRFFQNYDDQHWICNEIFWIGNDPPPISKFFRKFMTKSAVSNAKNCNEIFWIGNDPPPPFGNFPKIHPFWFGQASLRPFVFSSPSFQGHFLSILSKLANTVISTMIVDILTMTLVKNVILVVFWWKQWSNIDPYLWQSYATPTPSPVFGWYPNSLVFSLRLAFPQPIYS